MDGKTRIGAARMERQSRNAPTYTQTRPHLPSATRPEYCCGCGYEVLWADCPVRLRAA